MVNETALIATRNSLHAVAELVLAGGQHAACSRIALKVDDGGFSTRFEPDLAVAGGDLVGDFGSISLHGRTARELCTQAGTVLGDLSGVYADGAEYGADERLTIDPEAAAQLYSAWWTGHQALLGVAPGADPILWPEHFDVGISVGEVNLGVSPGDGYLAVPYAYVGPWTVPSGDPFFDAPFGAARAIAELGDVAGVTAFFAEGLRRLAEPAPPEKL